MLMQEAAKGALRCFSSQAAPYFTKQGWKKVYPLSSR